MQTKSSKNFKKRIEKAVKGANEKIREFSEWVRDNPKDAMALATGVLIGIGAAGRGLAAIDKRITLAKDRRDDRCKIYDPSLDIWWDTKKGLTNKQALEYQARVASGEKRGDVLRDMKVLRR